MIYSLITGGSSGLGYEMAKKMVKMGKNVIIMGRDEKKLNNSIKELKNISQEVKIIGVKIDISDLSEVDKFFLDLKTDNIEIEHLYNNAGKGFFGNVEKLTEYEISSILNSNLVGLINMTSRAITHMKSLKKKCRIINILSTAAQKGKKNETIYCASKWGAKGFLESVREEVQDGNIEIIILYPGGMNTPFWNDIDSGYDFLTFMNAEDVAEEVIHAGLNSKMLVSDLVINRRK